MKFDFDFNRSEWDNIISKVDFTDLELKIIHFRRRGWKWIDIAMELNFSESQIYRIKKKLILKIIRQIGR